MRRTNINKSRPIRRKRRTKAEMLILRSKIRKIVKQYKPMTVRQVFYQMVTKGHISKDEREYADIIRLLTEFRRDGTIPYEWIVDPSRRTRLPITYSSLNQFIEDSLKSYKRNIWDRQECVVEIWLEKEALSGILWEVTRRYHVPLMVGRGYSSVSLIHSVAQRIKGYERPVFIYSFGDHDPSGVDIERAMERELRTHAPDANMTFRRVAVTPRQIKKWNLPTRPTKTDDKRFKTFKGDSTELDAIDPDTLRRLCRQCIRRHLDGNALGTIHRAEKAELKRLNKLLRKTSH